MYTKFDFRRPDVLDTLRRCTLSVFREYQEVSIPLKNLDINAAVYLSMAARDLVVALETRLLGGPITEVREKEFIQHPADWWQWFKLEWFPDWLLRRYPVEFTVHTVEKNVHIHHYCPHIPVPGDKYSYCFDFVTGREDA